MFLAPVLNMKMLQNIVVLFDSLTGKNTQGQALQQFSTLLLTFIVSFIHSCIMFCKLFYVTLISYLNHGGRGHVESIAAPPHPHPTPPLAWVLGQALGGAARCIFPRSKPWLCMGTELGGLQSRKHVVESVHQ